MPPKKKKTFHFRSWMMNALRRASYRYPPRFHVMDAAKTPLTLTLKNGKERTYVGKRCNICNKVFKSSEVVADHIIPVIPPETGFPTLPNGKDDWITVIERLFCNEEGYQIICSNCHLIKTNKENLTRRNNKG